MKPEISESRLSSLFSPKAVDQKSLWRRMLVDAIKAKGVTQSQLARDIGIDPGLVTHMKNGHVPCRKNLEAIGRYLGILPQVLSLFGLQEPLLEYEEPTQLEALLRKEYFFTPKIIPFLEQLSLLPVEEQNAILAKRDKRVKRHELPEHARWNPISAGRLRSIARFGRPADQLYRILSFYCDKLNDGHCPQKVFRNLSRLYGIRQTDFKRLTYRGRRHDG